MDSGYQQPYIFFYLVQCYCDNNNINDQTDQHCLCLLYVYMYIYNFTRDIILIYNIIIFCFLNSRFFVYKLQYHKLKIETLRVTWPLSALKLLVLNIVFFNFLTHNDRSEKPVFIVEFLTRRGSSLGRHHLFH